MILTGKIIIPAVLVASMISALELSNYTHTLIWEDANKYTSVSNYVISDEEMQKYLNSVKTSTSADSVYITLFSYDLQKNTAQKYFSKYADGRQESHKMPIGNDYKQLEDFLDNNCYRKVESETITLMCPIFNSYLVGYLALTYSSTEPVDAMLKLRHCSQKIREYLDDYS